MSALTVHCSTNPVNPYVRLNEIVHEKTDRRWWAGRLCSSIKTIWQQKGTMHGLCAAASVPTALLPTLFLAYLCIEGTGRAMQEVVHTAQEQDDLSHDIGDGGGWWALAMDAMFALVVAGNQLVREGEYLELAPICKGWMEEMRRQGVQIDHDEFYAQVQELLEAFSGQSLSSKSVVDRKLYALSILRELAADISATSPMNSEYKCDRELAKVYRDIQIQKTALSASQFFNRAKSGISRPLMGSQLTVGLVCPIVYGCTSLMSAVGFVVLAKEVLGERIYVDMTGHVGEWGLNAVLSLIAGYFVSKWFLLSEGDLKLLRNIFNEHLKNLDPQKDPEIYESLRKVANDELETVASGCFHHKLPLDYKV